MECYKVELATSIGGQTLVGSSGDFPRQGGNCFDVLVDKDHIQIVNFKAENLRELVKRGLTWPIKIKRLGKFFGLIIDERIPDHWYTDRYCEVCTPKQFLNHFQLMRHERAVARGDRTENPTTGVTSFSIGPNPIFDYVGEKKVDLSNMTWRMGKEQDIKRFGPDGKPL